MFLFFVKPSGLPGNALSLVLCPSPRAQRGACRARSGHPELGSGSQVSKGVGLILRFGFGALDI